MEIEDWSATRDLNPIYSDIRKRGLEGHIAELEAYGFTVVPNALEPELLERARDAIVRVVESEYDRPVDLETGKGFTDLNMVYYLLFRDPVFETVLVNEPTLTLITYLLGQSCLLSSMTCHFKGPGETPLPLHSDNGNGMPAPFPAYSQVANINYALTDYTMERGCLAIVPGSHKLARQPHRDERMLGGPNGNPKAVPMEIPAGSAVLWHGNTWHGSYARQVPGIRMNLAVYFCRRYLQTQERFREAVPAEFLERHSSPSRTRTLLGLDTTYGWQTEGPDYTKMGDRASGSLFG